MSILRKIRRSAAGHVSNRSEWKVTWCDGRGQWHSRKFNDTELHRAWGWFHAKCAVCGTVAIYQGSGKHWEIRGGHYASD